MKELGITAHGESPFTTTYFRWDRSVAGVDSATDHVFYDRGTRLVAAKGTKVLARLVEPYFERNWQHFCSHFQTPPDKVTRFAAAVQRGNTVTIAYPVFQAFASHGSIPIRDLIEQSIDRLLPDPLLRLARPPTRRSDRHAAAGSNDRAPPELLPTAPRRGPGHRRGVHCVARPAAVAPARPPTQACHPAPQGEPIPFDYTDGRAVLKVSVLDGHQMVVFE